MTPVFIRNLIPRREKTEHRRPFFVALRDVTFVQWMLFISGWMAWTVDAADFFAVSLSVTALTKQFDRPTKSITTAITLTLLFRSLGAVIFGVISDRFGRKWPLVANLLLACVLEIGSGFVHTFPQFLAVRSLFGIAMGGIWGNASSTAMENLPVEVRGVASGIMQQGYDTGYIIAAVVNLYLVPETHFGWRSLFWTCGGLSFFAAAFRAALPESAVFLRARAARAGMATSKNKTTIFLHETKEMLRLHWKLCIYAVLLMTGFNFLSHGSGDLFPTYLQTTKLFTPRASSISTIVASTGAVVGGGVAGWASQYIGRSICLLFTAAFIPLWIIPDTFGALTAGAFWVSFGIHGAFGVIPIFLNELSPPAFRATFPGVAYQLGNMVSSASAQIEATAGAQLRTTVKGKVVPDYGKVQGIFVGVITVYTLILAIAGPENHGAHFERHKLAFEEGAAQDDALAESTQDHDSESDRDEKGERQVTGEEKA